MKGLGLLDTEIGGIVQGETGNRGSIEMSGHVVLGGRWV